MRVTLGYSPSAPDDIRQEAYSYGRILHPRYVEGEAGERGAVCGGVEGYWRCLPRSARPSRPGHADPEPGRPHCVLLVRAMAQPAGRPGDEGEPTSAGGV